MFETVRFYILCKLNLVICDFGHTVKLRGEIAFIGGLPSFFVREGL